jgi:alkane 1-monooxygenase
MTSHTLPAPEVYRDPKRWVWWFSLGVPVLIGLGPLLMLWRNDPLMLWWPMVFLYLAVPLADAVVGEARHNPPEWAVPQLEADRFYRYLTFALVPVLWVAFVFAVWFVASYQLPWWGVLAMVLNAGAVGGFGINLGHELGHKHNRLERVLAMLALAPSAYGHFTIEHNRGHHAEVATPTDCASARMGESIWRFVWREMPGAALRAWRLEVDRLRQGGGQVWSWHNQFLQGLFITAVLWGGLLLWLGWEAFPFMLLTAAWTNFQLTSANYVEHYGLLRLQQANGRYERCEPRHSWNSNHVFSNWILFQLQRHSDHHAHAARRYQALRHFDEAPQLPSGYAGMFLLAYVPPLWFAVMNPRLLKAVGRDPARINFAPGQREALSRQYNLPV